jgi:hypothetical protein
MTISSWSNHLLKNDWLFFAHPFKKYRDEHLSKIAAQLALALHSRPRQDIQLAQRDEKVLLTRKFLRHIKIEDPRIAECRKQLLAYKLGVKAEVFDSNPGFQKFAARVHLDRYLMEYQHRLAVEEGSNQVSILASGHYVTWNEASKMMAAFPLRTHTPNLPWIYGPNGLQNEDMYEWTELKPFKKGNPAEWGHRYIFEFCACCSSSPQKSGDHSWIRLKTPDGDIYSVGLYRPGKENWHGNFHFPFRVKEGYLMQPDVSEFWPCDIYAVPVEITQGQFLEMKRTIEHDKQNDTQTFQLFQSNCVLYTKKIARIAHIDLPTSKSAFRMLTPKSLEPLADGIWKRMPRVAKKICTFVMGFSFNLFQLAMGAGLVDATVKRKYGSLHQPYIRSFWDLFDYKKTELHHPNTVGQNARKWVREWREGEIAKLEEEKKHANPSDLDKINRQIEHVHYSIPPTRVY